MFLLLAGGWVDISLDLSLVVSEAVKMLKLSKVPSSSAAFEGWPGGDIETRLGRATGTVPLIIRTVLVVAAIEPSSIIGQRLTSQINLKSISDQHSCTVTVVGKSVEATLDIRDGPSRSKLSQSVGNGSWARKTFKCLKVEDKTNHVRGGH